jgi:hypothetical protein
VATVGGRFASYISTRVKAPLHSTLFIALTAIAVVFFLILIVAGIPVVMPQAARTGSAGEPGCIRKS